MTLEELMAIRSTESQAWIQQMAEERIFEQRSQMSREALEISQKELAQILIEDKELLKLAEEAQTEATVKISLNDLRAQVHKKHTY